MTRDDDGMRGLAGNLHWQTAVDGKSSVAKVQALEAAVSASCAESAESAAATPIMECGIWGYGELESEG
jgi:hypothetical protein